MRANNTMRRRAFSLIELVIVVVIIGIIAAIAIPRMSRGAAGANDASVKANLSVLRNAIDLYTTEHEGTMPAAATIAAQLTGKTDIAGAVGVTAGVHIYGPYLRSVPALPVGTRKGQVGIAAADAATIGWLYNATTGAIQTNTTGSEYDSTGTVLYSTY